MALRKTRKQEFEDWAVKHTYSIAEIETEYGTIYSELSTRCAWQGFKEGQRVEWEDSMYLE